MTPESCYVLRIHGVVSLSDTFPARMLTRFLRSSLYVFLGILGGSPAFLGQTTQSVFDFSFKLYLMRNSLSLAVDSS